MNMFESGYCESPTRPKCYSFSRTYTVSCSYFRNRAKNSTRPSRNLGTSERRMQLKSPSIDVKILSSLNVTTGVISPRIFRFEGGVIPWYLVLLSFSLGHWTAPYLKDDNGL